MGDGNKRPPSKFSGMFRVNAPVTLMFALACCVVTAAGYVSGGLVNWLFGTGSLFGILLHPFAHAGWEHLFGNMMLFLMLAPMAEEKYGSGRFMGMIASTALATGLIMHFLMPWQNMVGASGVVFMLIVLSSFTGKGEGFPVTAVLVMGCYLGKEFGDMVFTRDDVSQFGHIIGGICGTALGLKWAKGGSGDAGEGMQ